MKNLILLFLGLLLATIGQAQVTKTVNLTSAGTLSTVLTANELSSTVSLTLTGTIDARDFKTMRNDMPQLEEIDLGSATIAAYTGKMGTLTAGIYDDVYPANTLPQYAFVNPISFIGKKNISKLVLPSNLEDLGYGAFIDCVISSTNPITIPSTVTNIADDVFKTFKGTIIVDENNSFYSSIDGVLFNKAKTKLIVCPVSKTGNYTIPASVTTLERIAFEGCTSLRKITIPSSVQTIRDACFWGCSNLDTLQVAWQAPIQLVFANIFYNVQTQWCILSVPTGTVAAYQAAAQWNDFDHIEEISSSAGTTLNVTASNLKAMFTAEELATVSKLTLTGTIDARDFKTMRDEMPLLAELDLSGVSIVAYEGTEGTADAISSVIYPVNEVPQNAFINSNGEGKETLVSVIIPESATTVGQNAFQSCINLAQLIFPSSLRIIRDNAFQYCDKLTSIIIPNGVTTIGQKVFDNCTNIESVILPNTLTEISYGAFQHCTKLKDINIPASATTIRDYAFRNCAGPFIVDASNPNYSSLVGVLFDKNQTILIQCPISLIGDYTVPSSVKTIGLQSINYCERLKSVIIPEGVTSLGNQAFFVNDSLESISIPSTVTTFGNQAIAWNPVISSIYSYSATPADLSNSYNVFIGSDMMTNCTLYVPIGSKSAYQNAVQWLDFENIVEMQGLFPSTTSLSFNSFAVTTKIFIGSSVSWRAESSQNWLSINPASSQGSDSLSISVIQNTGDVRTATITVHPTGLTDKTITLTQYGNGILYVTAGNLAAMLGAELATTTSLTLVGTIDARDFKTMRDDMPLLTNIDLSGATIVEYSGHDGTFPPSEYGSTYFENVVPLMAFTGNQTITTVVLPANITGIFQAAFAGCTGLVSVNIPEGTEQIHGMAFNGCSNLTTIRIPSTITHLEHGVFSDCTNLNSVTVGWSTPLDLSYQPNVFDGVNKATCILYVPNGTTALYRAANQWGEFTNIVELSGNSITNELNLTDETINSGQTVCFNAYDNITVAGGETEVILSDNSNTTIIAGNSIRFLPGFHAQSGSWMDAHITTTNSFCIPANESMLAAQVEVEEKSIEVAETEASVVMPVEKTIKVYPNPNNGQFIVEVSNFETRATVSIYNMLGSKVYESEMTNDADHKINLLGIKKGIYFVKVTDQKEQFTKKIIVN